MVFVPVPPSKIKTDPLYDDRLVRTLQAMKQAKDVRELVIQTENMAASHGTTARPKPEDLVAKYRIDQTLCNPPPTTCIVDDVLTIGCHFRAMSAVLKPKFPSARIIGLFIARRVIPPADFSGSVAVDDQ